MSTINPIAWFELPVVQMKRAKSFYEKTFGYELGAPTATNGFEMSMFPMTQGGDGAPGALIHGSGYKPSHDGALLYFSVDNIPPVEKKITENGGKVYKPKMSIGEYGFISICEDSEGNRIALHSRV